MKRSIQSLIDEASFTMTENEEFVSWLKRLGLSNNHITEVLRTSRDVSIQTSVVKQQKLTDRLSRLTEKIVNDSYKHVFNTENKKDYFIDTVFLYTSSLK